MVEESWEGGGGQVFQILKFSIMKKTKKKVCQDGVREGGMNFENFSITKAKTKSFFFLFCRTGANGDKF